ncbi:MAG: CxxC-x17-CxxC domain-containing protein [Candidatus Sungiibacteriota bacterium]
MAFQDQRSGGNGGWQDDRPRYDITCSKCGAPDSVPFPPTAGRDVYCKNCWREANPRPPMGGGGGGRGGGRGFSR